jgi:hypothetical protein
MRFGNLDFKFNGIMIPHFSCMVFTREKYFVLSIWQYAMLVRRVTKAGQNFSLFTLQLCMNRLSWPDKLSQVDYFSEIR